MTSENNNEITSEEYADLLINYSGDVNVINAFANAIVNRINYIYALVHIPVGQITNSTIQEYGYAAMPKLYGLTDSASLEASGVLRIRNIPNFNLRGQGVLLGIVDTGIDYTNPVFMNADGTTRIVSIWDQTIASENPPQAQGYGTVYTREQINEALQSEDPLELVPSTDTNGHGTMVAGIAGGSEDTANDFTGVAPDSEFAIVKLKPAKQYLKNFFFVPEAATAFQENDIIFAVDYLLSVAFSLNRPMAICIPLGTSQGSHSGRGILSNYLSLVASTPGIVIVLPAGNEGNMRRHYSGIINPSTGTDTVELNVGEDVEGFSMELWGLSPSIFSIDILSPSGEYVPRISVGMNDNREISFIFERTVIYVDYQMVESQTGDQLILLRFANPASGIWRMNVYERGDLHLGFNIWLPMGDFITESTFFTRSDPYITVLAPGNAEIPITTTAYNISDDSLYIGASRGYTRTNNIKPDVAAPGVNITGPTLDDSFNDFTGTSTSAAHTAGIAAMILEWGIVRGNLPDISSVEVKKLILRGARREPDIIYPNRDWGFGILDIYNVFDSLRTGVIV